MNLRGDHERILFGIRPCFLGSKVLLFYKKSKFYFTKKAKIVLQKVVLNFMTD